VSASPDAGLCGSCRFAEIIRNDRGSLFYRCGKSFEDSRFARYPALPVLACVGYEKGPVAVKSNAKEKST